ncbi:MAG: type IV pilus twitching motility protein PilT [Gemmatimonadales bacterium]
MSTAPIERIIKAAVERGASDIHIKAGDLFRARIDGRLVPLTKQRLTPAQTRAIALKLIPSEEDRKRLDELTDYDCSWGLPGSGRFRVSLLRQRSSVMIVMRVIPFAIPTIEELGLPEAVADLAESSAGLLLVTGPAGSGKSSAIAALLAHLNQTVERHIVTVEDPIEFLHRDLKSSVTQREVGIDTGSVVAGVRAAMRHDPDVIVIGEIGDAVAMETAMQAAERGVLVIGAIHAADSVAALTQVIAYLGSARDNGRERVAEALQGVVALRLAPRADGEGRVPLVELLLATPEVRAAIKRADGLAELPKLMDAGGSPMQTFAAEAERLAGEGVIDEITPPAPAPRRGRRGRR